MKDESTPLESLSLELRRGTLFLAALSRLSSPQYGYSLVQALQQKGIDIDPSTLYPLLRRLESQGLLESVWDLGEKKPRKYYKRTPLGETLYQQLKTQWQRTAQILQDLLKEEAQ